MILRLDDDAFSGEKLLRTKRNYILKRFHVQVIRERILACSGVNTGPFGQMVDLLSFSHPTLLIQPEIWVYSKMFQL